MNLFFLIVVYMAVVMCGSPSSKISDSLSRALGSDHRIEWLHSAFLIDPQISDWLTEFPLTVISPTDDAVHRALQKKRLFCAEHQPCLSFSHFLHSPFLEATLLRHVFSGNISIESITSDRRLVSLNGVSIRVERRQGWDLRFAGARVVENKPEIDFPYGKIILVNDVLMDYSQMNASYVKIAEILTDIGPFDEHERNLMVEIVMENVECFRMIRSAKLHDTTVFPFVFQPAQDLSTGQFASNGCGRKPLKKFSTDESSLTDKFQSNFRDSDIVWKIPRNVKRPRKRSNLAFMSILELVSLLRQGLVTSVELTELYINRLKRFNKYLEAVITYTEELALRQARLADQEMKMGIYRSPLQGIPYGLKDLIAVPGYPTTWGAQALQNQTFDKGSWVYEKLSEAGAVHVAKLSTGAMAWGDIWFGGRTKNPWNIKQSSCGSSSGSGAATVAGLIPFSLGTETWGSISCPASTMGISALRPTFGSIGRSGTMPLAWSLDKIGAFCRTTLDCAIVLDALRGVDSQDPSSVSAPMIDPQTINANELTIGYTTYTDSNVVKEFKRLGIKMKLINFEINYPVDAVINVLLGAEASANFDEWIRSNTTSSLSNDENWISFIQGSRVIPAAEYLLANKVRAELIELGKKMFENVDAILIPSSESGNQVAFGNLIGVPEVILPVGFEDIPGSHLSPRKQPKTQALIGAPFTDGTLLGIAALYQKATNYHLERPPVEKVEPHVLNDCLPFSQCSFKTEDKAVKDG